MNDNLNNLINISEFKKEFLIEIADLYENIEKVKDDMVSEIDKEHAIKFFLYKIAFFKIFTKA